MAAPSSDVVPPAAVPQPTTAGPPFAPLFLVFLLALAVPAAVVLTLQELFLGPERLAALVTANQLSKPNRDVIILTGVGAGVLACLAVVFALLWRAKDQFHVRLARMQAVTTFLAPLLLSPFLPAFWNWRAWQGNHILKLLLIWAWGVAFQPACLASAAAARDLGLRFPAAWSRRFAALPRRVPSVAVGVLVGLCCLYFSAFTILNHLRMQTAALDLGVFDNIMWQLTRGHYFRSTPAYGGLNGCHIARHANFVAYLFVPFYALLQRAETLLAMQASLLVAAAVPLYLVARRRLGSDWLGLGIAAAYLVYAPMHSPMFYDFHFLTTAPFFVGWAIYFFDKRSTKGLAVAGIVALLVREDVGAGLCLLSLFFLLQGEEPSLSTRCGVVAAVYFVLMKFVIMPLHAVPGDMSFADVYEGLYPAGEFGFGSALRTLYVNPVFTAGSFLRQDKIEFLLQVMVPVLFLPFRHKRAWLPLVASLMFTIFATLRPFSEIHFQYVTHWNSYVFFMTTFVLADWRSAGRLPGGRLALSVATVVIVGVLCSYQDGALFQHNTFQGGFRHVEFTWSPADAAQRQDFRFLADQIPPSASVAATETEVPQLSNRARCYTMRIGVEGSDFVLVRLDEVRGEGGSRRNFLDALRTRAYGFVAARGAFALWQKGAPHDRDDEGLRLVNALGQL